MSTQLYSIGSTGNWTAPGRSGSTLVSPSANFPTLTFNEDFTGTTLDTTRWNINHYQLAYEMSENTSNNVFIRNNQLVISAVKETSPNGKPWTTGYIDTRGGGSKFQQQYGRFEARIKVNTAAQSAGLWPAFWLRPNNTSYTGEFDIMECWGEPGSSVDGGNGYATQHYPTGGGYTSLLADTNHTDNRKTTITLHPPTGQRLSDDFHIYGFEWTSTTMAMYLDNTLVGGPYNHTDVPWYANYETPFHLRLQMQVGQLKNSYPDLTPGYWGIPDANTPAYSEMLVDWVRVWGP